MEKVLCGEENEGGVESKTPLCLFWIIWKVRKRIVFDDVELFIQTLKEAPPSLAGFIDWLVQDGVQLLVSFF